MQRVDNPVTFSCGTNALKAVFVTGLAVGTCALVIGAATTTSTVALVIFSALAITAAAVSIASMTAAFSERASTIDGYFKAVGDHLKIALPAMWQFVAQTLVQALIEGCAKGITDNVYQRFTGRHVTRISL